MTAADKAPAKESKKQTRKRADPGVWVSIDPDNLPATSFHTSRLAALIAGEDKPNHAINLPFGTTLAEAIDAYRTANNPK